MLCSSRLDSFGVLNASSESIEVLYILLTARDSISDIVHGDTGADGCRTKIFNGSAVGSTSDIRTTSRAGLDPFRIRPFL